MPTFTYRARTGEGNLVTSTIDAETSKAAAARLQESGLFPVELRLRAGRRPGLSRFGRRGAPSGLALVVRELSDLVRSGIPLPRALQMMAAAPDRPGWGAILGEVQQEVQSGSALTEALAHQGEVFSPLVVGVIRAGESGGALDAALDQLAAHLEREEEAASRFRAALAYPAVVVAVGVGTVVFLLYVVIPKFVVMFGDLGAALPLPTRAMMTLSQGLGRWWWAYLPALGAAAAWAAHWLGGEDGTAWRDRALVRLPIWGRIARRVISARVARVFSLLVKNGVPILQGLRLAGQAAGNRTVEGELKRVAAAVEGGSSLAEAIRAHAPGVIPLVGEMAGVGEETGDLEAALGRAADILDREAQQRIRTALSLIEPLLIVAVGAVVGAVVLSVILPVFEMSAVLR